MQRLQSTLFALLQKPSRLPLRTVLIIPFVVQIVAAVGLTGYLSFRNGQQAVNDLVDQLQTELNERIEQKLQVYFATPLIINQINSDMARLGLLNLDDLDTVEKYLWRQFQQFSQNEAQQLSHITILAIATEATGDYVEVGYAPNEAMVARIRNTAQDQVTRTWNLSPLGSRTGLFDENPDYEPRQRPWYESAVNAGEPVWVGPYIARFNQELFISSNQVLSDSQGNVLGVTNATLSLADVSKFLTSLESHNPQASNHRRAFVMSREEGNLFASSTADQYPVVATDSENNPQLLTVLESHDPIIQATSHYLQNTFGQFTHIPREYQSTFQYNGEQFFLQVEESQYVAGPGLFIVIVIPESEFMEQINASTRTTVWLCVIALGGAIAFGITTSRWITRPILRLSQAAEALSQGDWDQDVTLRRRDELGVLAQAFNQMRSDLKQSQQQLEAYNRDLENLVEERTQKLRESEEKFAKAFRSSPEPIAIAALHPGIILEVNESFLQLTGYTQVEVLGKTATDLNLWADLEDRDCILVQLYNTGMVRNQELMMQTRTGDIKTVLLSAEVIELNQQTSVLFVLSDISDRKKTEAALQEAKDAADVANQAKSIFLASMSHELRTPLNAILGFTQLMTRNPAFASASKELDIISRSGEHLLALINDILDVSKIEAGQIILHEEAFDLYALLSTLEDMLRLRARSKSLILSFCRTSQVPRYVKTDAKKLRQVLINLLGNAIKFTQSGSVTLRVQCQAFLSETGVRWVEGVEHPEPLRESDRLDVGDRAPEISETQSVEFSPDATMALYFAVEDTGPGIAPEELDQLFAPFVQTETGRQAQQGTGLGLSISRKFVQLMGGDIAVCSVLGQGSCFYFSIQAQVATADQVHRPTPQRRVLHLAPGQPTYRILVVDEVYENRLLLKRLLEPIGFEVIEAEHGLEAIQKWQMHSPHLIWMDMRMPVMDGYEATRQIRLQEQQRVEGRDPETSAAISPDSGISHPLTSYSHTTIIALTASALEQDREHMIAAGCDDYVRKPFQEAEIWETMTTHLGVQFLYEDLPDLNRKPGTVTTRLKPESLQVMSADWIQQMHYASVSGDDSVATELAQQIPEDYADLAIALQSLIDNFRLDTISDLTSPQKSSSWVSQRDQTTPD